MVNGLQMAVPEGAEAASRFVPVVNLGSGGLFMAIIIGLLVPEVQRLARKNKWEIRMPAGVPPAVGRSFSALIPGSSCWCHCGLSCTCSVSISSTS